DDPGRRHFSVLVPCADPLELQAALTGGIRKGLDLAMEKEAAAVEINLLDAGGLGARSDLGADPGSRFLVVLAHEAQILLERRGGSQGPTLDVVNQLDGNVLRRAVHRKPRALTRQLPELVPDAQAALLEQVAFAVRHTLRPYFFLPSLRKMNSSR